MTIKFQKVFALAALGMAVTAYSGVTAAAQVDPGWYFGIEGFSSKVKDADGTATTTATNTVAPVGGVCPSGSTPVLGGLLDPLNVLIPSGLTALTLCVIAPAGGTPGSSTTQTVTAPTSATFKNSFGGGFSLGYMFNGGFRPELNFAYTQNDLKTFALGGTDVPVNNTTITAYRAMANAWFDFDFGIPVTPYLGGGVGAQLSKLESDGSSANDTTFTYQLGGGVNFWATSKLALSLDYRYVVAGQPTFETTTVVGGSATHTSQQSDYKAQQIGVGLKYLFGEFGRDVGDKDGDGVPDRLDKCPNTPKGVQVNLEGCPLDSDGDGVPDYLDKCPGTAKGAVVNAEGCVLDSDGDGVPDYLDKCPNTPKGVQVDANGCPSADSDGDGVPDYLDKCPKTPVGQKVGPDGCPLDSDGDGIPDDQDECPNTPAGAKVLPNGCALKGDCRRPRPGEQVDEHGCAVEHSFILKGVKFEFDSDRLTPAAKEILNQVGETLKAYPEVNVEVQGHTDYIGTDAYNLGLSEKRAIAVKVYLGGKGVQTQRLSPVGYGKTRPIDTNETEAGRENNRRVELKVLE